jgi:hypothetical protein
MMYGLVSDTSRIARFGTWNEMLWIKYRKGTRRTVALCINDTKCKCLRMGWWEKHTSSASSQEGKACYPDMAKAFWMMMARKQKSPKATSDVQLLRSWMFGINPPIVSLWIDDSITKRAKWWGPQLKYLWQLFIKNTAPCELARECIGGDTWPMPEGQITALRSAQRMQCKKQDVRGKESFHFRSYILELCLMCWSWWLL